MEPLPQKGARIMETQTYHIQVSTQLGPRCGTLTLTDQAGILRGTLELLGHANAVSGQMLHAGFCVFSGQMQTLVSTIPYQAACTLHDSGLQGVFHTLSGDFTVTGQKAAPEH